MSGLQALQELNLVDTAITGLELGKIYGFKSQILNVLCARGCAIRI
jgi:hypothetical protein